MSFMLWYIPTERMTSGRSAATVSFHDRTIMSERAKPGDDDRVHRVHDAGTDERADRVQVVRGERHEIAGAVLVVENGAELLEVGEEVAPHVELDLARYADDDPPHEKAEDAAHER